MITITRDGNGPLLVRPATVEVDATSFSTPQIDPGHYRLRTASGWRTEPVGALHWRVWPEQVDLDRPARFTLLSLADGELGTVVIPVYLDLRSTFDPALHALPRRNRATDLGEWEPRFDTFERTYGRMPKLISRMLFGGLYSDIVYLRSDGNQRGGLCTGMARWALARSSGVEQAPATEREAIERIAIYHGRQLTDRSLMNALPWFLRGSPAAAFRAVRRDLLRHGSTDRAFDVAVPKLWRRDVSTAVVQEGHTVVPFRLRQTGTDIGEVEVYDPNHPDAVDGGQPRTMRFDLANDRYSYGTRVTLEQSNIGLIAAPQSGYARPGSAVIAAIGSLLLAPRRVMGVMLSRNNSARK